MNKKLRCGRLILTNDGIIKKLDLANGGGVRSCDWNRNDTTFNDIHYRLLDIFNLKGRKHETLLYDFQLRPINVKRYATFGEYIDKYALSCNSTVMYLCSREVDGIDKSKILITNKGKSLSIKPLHSSTFNQQIFTQTKSNSSKTSIGHEHVVSNEPYFNPEEIPSSFLEYSFKNSIKDLIKNVRYLINQNSFDDILLQLFEYICTIHGFISSTIDPLIKQMQQSNEYIRSISSSEIVLHSNSLNNAYDICSSTKRLLNQNKNKFGHIQIFSTITNSFSHFYDNLQNLQNHCLKYMDKNKNKLNTTSISSSSIHSSIELISSHSHIQLSSEAKDHRELKRENSRKSSHSYQTRSSSHVFKSTSSSRESYDEGTSERSSLFQPILNHLRHLLNLLSSKHLSPFRELVESSIDKIKSVRTSINLNNEQSILDGKRVILFIKEQFINKSVDLYYNQSKCDLDQQLNVSCENILAAIQVLFTSLYYFQMQIDQNNRHDDSNWSSPPPPYIDQRQSENKRSMHSNKRKSQVLHGDDHHG